MSDTPSIAVKYVRNADETLGTSAVNFNDDDRPALQIGSVGLVTEEERLRLENFGIILEQVEDDQVPEDVKRAVEGDEPEDLNKLTVDELKQRVTAAGGDVSGKNSKAALIDELEEALTSPQGEGAASLPATATTGPGQPVAGAAAPAGPGGAGAGTAAGGGPATTGGGA